MNTGIGSVAGLQGFGDPVMFRFPEEMGHSYMGTALAVNEHGLTIQGSSIPMRMSRPRPVSGSTSAAWW